MPVKAVLKSSVEGRRRGGDEGGDGRDDCDGVY